MAASEILISAGEISGDLHAAPVVDEIKLLSKEVHLFGPGGDLMREAGVDLIEHVDQMAVMGFSGVLNTLPRLSRLKKMILRQIIERKVRLVILVDYPGFHLNLARAIKKLPDPPRILYYISPQIWAWRSGRIDLIRQVVDHIAVIFPFEEEIFRKAGVPVTFVGHPLIDELSPYLSRLDMSGCFIPSGQPILALLPGSRKQEVINNLPAMIETAIKLREQHPGLQAIIGCASNLPEGFYTNIFNGMKDKLAVETVNSIIMERDSRRLLMKASAAIVCSGTATLEAALLGTPQVVVYKTTNLNYQLIRRLIKIKNIALVNVVAGEDIVPEILQNDFNCENLIKAVSPLLGESAVRKRQIDGYGIIRDRLGEGGASKRVAQIAIDMLEGNNNKGCL